jgi:hypothetical protein
VRTLFNRRVLEPSSASGTLVYIANDLPQPQRNFFIQAANAL